MINIDKAQHGNKQKTETKYCMQNNIVYRRKRQRK